MIPVLKVPGTDFSFTRIGFGCEQLGMHNWGNVDATQLNVAVNDAIDHGINYFDTADVYGLGKSEENLAAFLGNRRKQIHIITKFGVRFKGSQRFFDNSSEWIQSALEDSLRRLKTDYIDLYQLHYWDGKTHLDQVAETLSRLKEQGKIKAFGFSNVVLPALEEASHFSKLSASCSYEFSLAERKNETEIQDLQKRMIFLAYGGLGQGILSGKYHADSVFLNNDRRSSERYVNFHGERLKKNLSIVAALQKIAEQYNVSVAAVALRYIIDFLPNSSIICGIKNSQQLQDNLNVFKFSLDQNELQLLTNISHGEGLLSVI